MITQKNSHPKRRKRLIFLIFSITIISFLLKYASEWTHEFLGHCGFGWLAGGTPQSWYVSWIWPLEFGYASVTFPIGTGSIPKAIMIIGGISACLIAAFTSHLLLFRIGRKKVLPKEEITTTQLLIFHGLYWYGFWAFINSIGYLILGGLTDFGDIHLFKIYTGIPSWIIITIGFLAFFILYYLISFNCAVLFRPLLPHTSTKRILIVFWLSIPLIFVLIFLNPDLTVSAWMVPVGMGFATTPSILMLFLGKRFPENINWRDESS
ncbi:MAG: hypothetical protein ACTSQI_14430 [Candidatus Helarchaeota archaeon]